MSDENQKASDGGRGVILKADGIYKSFPVKDTEDAEDKIHVINGASMEVYSGESVSIRGQSGAGKTTLLNLISGLQSPDKGTVYWEGKNLELFNENNLAEFRGSFLGFIFQSYYLIPELTAEENILLSYLVVRGRKGEKGGISRRDVRKKAESLMDKVGILTRKNHLPSELSGGERQRVSICRALMNDPKLILADEPTGNLDEHTGEEVMGLLLELCKDDKLGLVLVTHNPDYAQRTNRQYVLREGSLH